MDIRASIFAESPFCLSRAGLNWAGVAARGTASLFLMILLSVSARAYHSEYLFTKAQLGPKTINEYHQLLASAAKQNPYQNEVNLKIANVLQTRNQWDDSQVAVSKSAAGVNHWQGWEMQAMAWERLAFTDAGTLLDAEKSASIFDRVLKVNPSYIKGIERRALLGLKLGNWESVRGLAAQLTALDANNQNAVYLRARVAEGQGDDRLAKDLYAELSAGGVPPANSWFSIAEIERKLQRLSEDSRR